MKKNNRYSLIANNYPSFQNIKNTALNGYRWMQSRQNDDKAEGLWRIHDKIYDLTDFIKHHPGGSDWLELTKGTDITESFEIHHLNSEKATATLKQYEKGRAKEKRNFKFSFKSDGFYKTLQRRIYNKLKDSKKKPEFLSKIMIDTLLYASFLTAILTIRLDSTILMLLSSLLQTYTVISAHNFFHQKDNFRMYYFNLTFFSYKEWRITHAMSHHLYPNSLHDMEVAMFEPFLCWIPNPATKQFVQRYLSWVYSPIVYMGLYIDQFVKRVVLSLEDKTNLFYKHDLIPLALPLAMLLFGGQFQLFVILKTWLYMLLVGSFIFGFIGLNAGHHNTDTIHDGDKLRENLDWGIYTLDTIVDNSDLKTHFLSLTHFGHHAMHHLFPTIDHGCLSQMYPILYETMAEFETNLDEYPWYFHIAGQFKQLARVKVKDVDPGERYQKRKIDIR